MTNMKPFVYITLAEAAKIAQKDISTLRNAVKKEYLLAVKVGKTWLTDKEALTVWLNDPEVHKTGKRSKK